MSREIYAQCMRDMFGATRITIDGNFALFSNASRHAKQQQTNEMFSEKWQKYEQSAEKERLYQYQRDWYLRLYGFDIEAAFASYLTSKNVIFDAGCGLGYKAAWFAKLAPHALVLGMDFSEAAKQAAQSYRNIDNLFFIQGDIASTGLRDGVVDYTSCDQVIMHTEDPEKTFAELARITSRSGELACYFYATKAVPRELLDDYFRTRSLSISREALWAMSVQLTELGQRLSALQISIDVPDIPELGIKGGRQDLQRFIYWNFLKCFWSAELGRETSILTNFDWYSPSNAQRFREPEVHALVEANGMVKRFFHTEEACYSGRFAHR